MKEYPLKHGKLFWDEIEILEQALGFHGKIFLNNVISEKQKNAYLSNEDFFKLLESDVLYPYLDKTFNHHDGSYNIKVVAKAIELLAERYISFSTLRVARVSFQVYEHVDHAGLEDRLVARAMKLCGKTMAPLKLKHMLRHMNKLVIDRVMIYEYLDILASADSMTTVAQEVPSKKVVKEKVDDRSLYELCDFEDELSTFDERCQRYLNMKFQESLKIIPVGTVTKPSTQKKAATHLTALIKPPLADGEVRKKMTQRNQVQSAMLGSYLHSSNNAVRNCRCGEACTCQSNVSEDTEVTKQIEEVANDGGELEMNKSTAPERSRQVDLIVTQKDLEETAHDIETVQWEMATHKQRTRMKLEKRKNRPNRETSTC